jgi:tetratricopeptide (TPR) repeat protein
VNLHSQFCRVCSDALRLEPNSPEVLALRGLVLFLSGKLPQAIQHASSALRLDPGHELAQKLRKRVKDVERLKDEGNIAFKTGMLEEAVDKYTEALEVSRSLLTVCVLYIDLLFSSVLDQMRKKVKAGISEQRYYQIVPLRY